MAETIIWAARDTNGSLYLYKREPTRLENGDFTRMYGTNIDTEQLRLMNMDLPQVTNKNSPIKINLAKLF